MKTAERVFIYLEISFWKVVIPLMIKARSLQQWVEKTFPFIPTEQILRFTAQGIILAGVGLTIGFAAGYLRAPR